jgi:hypothetical protein
MAKYSLYKNDIFFIVLIFLIIILGIYQYYRNSDFDENIKYTIGYTTKSAIAASGTKYTNFHYTYRAENYGGAEKFKKSIKVPDGKYLVGFSSENPMNCKMYFEYEIPDSVNYSHVPKQGWDSIPKFIIEYNKTLKKKR